MRIEQLHHFTEHHRFIVYRGFSMSPLDAKMLSLIYQPMTGAPAVSLYMSLYHQLDESRTGYSRPDTQRKLLLGLGLDLNEAGRRQLIDLTSRLEAVGLLQTYRVTLPDGDDAMYEYELLRPLDPTEFFTNPHFTLLLRDKIGKYAVIALREQFESPIPEELADPGLSRAVLSVPFFDVFRVQPHSADAELEQALAEIGAGREPAPALAVPPGAGISYSELIAGFPQSSENRPYVERLRADEEGMAVVNYVAYKYDLDAIDMRRLLDEPGIFSPDGGLLFEELQRRASLFFRQDRKLEEERNRITARTAAASGAGADGADGGDPPEEVPVAERDYLPVPEALAGQCDIAQYNMLMRNEPHTRFLRRFFPGAVPAWLDRLFEKIDLHYRMPNEVINVFIHYIIGMNGAQRLSGDFMDKVASNMLAKRIDTYEKAVRYVREQAELELRMKEAERRPPGAQGKPYRGGRGGGARKPAIPIVEQRTGGRQLSPEELAEALRLASELERES